MVVEVQTPSPGRLREGYEAIPDSSWLRVVPEQFSLQPGETMDCEIIVAIPEDEEYENRHFQAIILARTVSDPGDAVRGVFMDLAMANVIRFSTGDTPEATMDEYRSRIMESLNVSIDPYSLNAGEITPGEEIILDGFDRATPQIINRGRNDFKISFEVVDSQRLGRYGISRDFEPAPESGWLTLKEEKIKSDSRTIRDIPLKINVPDSEKYRGKNYAFVIRGMIDDYDIPIELFSRIYIRTEE